MTTSITPTHSFAYAGARLNVFHANAGEGLPKHNHQYAHATYCSAGAILVRKEGIEVRLDKNSTPVSLKPVEWHEIEAIEDGTVFTNVFEEGKQS